MFDEDELNVMYWKKLKTMNINGGIHLEPRVTVLLSVVSHVGPGYGSSPSSFRSTIWLMQREDWRSIRRDWGSLVFWELIEEKSKMLMNFLLYFDLSYLR